jgi:hypothetical protein
VLTRQGVTAWRRTLVELAPDSATRPSPASPLLGSAAVRAPIAAELVDALVSVTLAGT